MKHCKLESPITSSVGVIEEMKTNSSGMAKYKIAYRDYRGREYMAWTTWMRDDGYRPGDSIPVNNLSIPSFGLLNLPLTVNSHPQRYVEPYIAAIVAVGLGAFVAGHTIGKNSKA